MTTLTSYHSLPRLIGRALLLGAVIAGMLVWHGGQWQYDGEGAARHHFIAFNPWAVPPAAPDHEKGGTTRAGAVAVCATVKRVVREIRTGGIIYPRTRTHTVYERFFCPDPIPRHGKSRPTRAPPAGAESNAYIS